MRTTPPARRYWLVKSEPEAFSFDDLIASPRRTTSWDGVRNYQARNFMRDDMKRGDLVFFYHSNAEPTAIVGVAEVVRESYPDPTALDPADPHFDPKSRAEAPTWVTVDLRAVEPLVRPLTLADLRTVKGLEQLALLQKGSRLSVQPVSPEEWAIIHDLGMVGRPTAGTSGRAHRIG
jgi:predicted RNA-binding protein with PUA-like domain